MVENGEIQVKLTLLYWSPCDILIFMNLTNITSNKRIFNTTNGIILLIIVLLIGIGIKYKDQFVAAKVNNSFITKAELSKELDRRYGKEILDELITLKLVEDQLKKENVHITKEEIDNKITEVQAGITGSLDEILKEQKITEKEFRDQIALQIGVEKLLKPKITVSDQEIADFVTTYEAQLQSSDAESRKAEARQLLADQKLSQEINNWIQSLRDNAQIENYF